MLCWKGGPTASQMPGFVLLNCSAELIIFTAGINSDPLAEMHSLQLSCASGGMCLVEIMKDLFITSFLFRNVSFPIQIMTPVSVVR